MSKSKDVKREEKYCRAVSKQVDEALRHKERAAASLSRQKAKKRKKIEAQQARTAARKEAKKQKSARQKAWRIKRQRPIETCEAGPAYLELMPASGPPGSRRFLSDEQTRRNFFRTFWLTALLLACPLIALWGMGEAYTAVRVNGFADYTPPLAVYSAADGGGFRFFDFLVHPENLAAPVRMAIEVLWRLFNPALRLVLDLSSLLQEALHSAI